METAGLCQWCALWEKDKHGRMGTCGVAREFTVMYGGHKRGKDTLRRKIVARIATHADDGCEKHFVEKAGVFSPTAHTVRPTAEQQCA